MLSGVLYAAQKEGRSGGGRHEDSSDGPAQESQNLLTIVYPFHIISGPQDLQHELPSFSTFSFCLNGPRPPAPTHISASTSQDPFPSLSHRTPKILVFPNQNSDSVSLFSSFLI